MRSVRLTNSLNSAALTDASSMFSGCAELVNVELNNVANGTSLTNVASMFAGATSSAAIAGEDTRYSVSNFATARTVNATSVFANMTRLKSFTGTDMVKGAASTLTGAFAGAQSLTNLTLTNVGTGSGAILTGAFRGSLALATPATTLDPEPDYLSRNTSATWTLTNVGSAGAKWDSSFEGGFKNSALSSASVKMTGSGGAAPTSQARQFFGCERLTSIDLSAWTVAASADVSSQFEGCGAIRVIGSAAGPGNLAINASQSQTGVANRSRQFAGMVGLTSATVYGMTDKASTNLTYLMSGNTALTSATFTGIP
ncbi:BspA family leucine-rich repeat surface protein, partial [Dubosiella newyorkensis]|uniref:BspA family leucine-rich repeat surface protein n=1 Tax=Dubosiella newyorkensis TaxID=1862672 RepID=UPI00259C85F4